VAVLGKSQKSIVQSMMFITKISTLKTIIARCAEKSDGFKRWNKSELHETQLWSRGKMQVIKSRKNMLSGDTLPDNVSKEDIIHTETNDGKLSVWWV